MSTPVESPLPTTNWSRWLHALWYLVTAAASGLCRSRGMRWIGRDCYLEFIAALATYSPQIRRCDSRGFAVETDSLISCPHWTS